MKWLPLRARKRTRSRDKFVLAGLESFETKGFAETTVDEIADRAMLSFEHLLPLLRFMEYADSLEQEIVDAVTKSQGTDPAIDIYARAIAVAAVGAFRIAAERFSPQDAGVLEHFEATLELMDAGLVST